MQTQGFLQWLQKEKKKKKEVIYIKKGISHILQIKLSKFFSRFGTGCEMEETNPSFVLDSFDALFVVDTNITYRKGDLNMTRNACFIIIIFLKLGKNVF